MGGGVGGWGYGGTAGHGHAGLLARADRCSRWSRSRARGAGGRRSTGGPSASGRAGRVVDRIAPPLPPPLIRTIPRAFPAVAVPGPPGECASVLGTNPSCLHSKQSNRTCRSTPLSRQALPVENKPQVRPHIRDAGAVRQKHRNCTPTDIHRRSGYADRPNSQQWRNELPNNARPAGRTNGTGVVRVGGPPRSGTCRRLR
ncbi:hypothetical protein UO65_3387 [Actinokineospora spheciospongiae]|uniref:Uncharacterized protein n=1 Tax=Actinokineospora spheciospongiae TaxID=909613 RepID=W7IXW5_9PSEU|nr:hypothetical protein UO65_3387 [Actinokineospora spheciospongiae]